jgi:hypothetical protein
MVASLYLFVESDEMPRDILSQFLRGIGTETKVRNTRKRKGVFASHPEFTLAANLVYQVDVPFYKAAFGFTPTMYMSFLCTATTAPVLEPAPESAKSLAILGTVNWINETKCNTAMTLETGKAALIYILGELQLIGDSAIWTEERLKGITMPYKLLDVDKTE